MATVAAKNNDNKDVELFRINPLYYMLSMEKPEQAAKKEDVAESLRKLIAQEKEKEK